MPTPVTIVESGGIPVTNSTLGAPFTPVESGGIPITLVDDGGMPMALVNDDLSAWVGSLSAALLAAETDGLAFVSTDTDVSEYGSLTIKDTVTPANSYSGHPFTFGGGKLTHARSTTALQLNASGLWEEVAINRPKVYRDHSTLVSYGYWPEESRISALSDDLTNAAWTKTNCTAAKTATGADGVANSASTLTATAANGFARQSITATSAQRVSSLAVRRRTGTGAVTLSQGETTGSELVTNGGFDSDTVWTKGGAWIISGGVATNDGSSGFTHLSQNLGLVQGKVYRVSFTLNSGTLASIRLGGNTGPNAIGSNFSSAGTVTVVGPCIGSDGTLYITAQSAQACSIDNISVLEVAETTLSLTSDWQRLPTAAATITDPAIIIKLATSGDEIDVQYVQCEAGAFMTSPIPTQGGAVTRAACTESNATTLMNHSATAGTLYVEGRAALGKGTHVYAQMDDGTANERCRIVRDSSGDVRFIVTDGGVEQANLNLGAVADGAAFKVAASWKANDFAASLNGGAVVTDTGGTLPTVTTLRFGNGHSGEQANGPVIAGLHLPRDMTDAELIARAA